MLQRLFSRALNEHPNIRSLKKTANKVSDFKTHTIINGDTHFHDIVILKNNPSIKEGAERIIDIIQKSKSGFFDKGIIENRLEQLVENTSQIPLLKNRGVKGFQTLMDKFNKRNDLISHDHMRAEQAARFISPDGKNQKIKFIDPECIQRKQ